jgi:hypothetical protein
VTKRTYSGKIRVLALIMVIAFVSGCSSSTVIRSRPDGASVYIDNIQQGTTPLQYSDTAIAGTTKPIRLKKEGYKPLDTVIRKDKFQAGPCIGGVLVLFPFIWVLGYQDVYEFELEKLQ